jgi:hypothetical protein
MTHPDRHERREEEGRTVDERTVEAYRVRCATADDLVAAVVKGVATVSGDEPLALPPLQEVIDSDALETLLAHDAEVEVTFPYAGYAVSVSSEAEVVVRRNGLSTPSSADPKEW